MKPAQKKIKMPSDEEIKQMSLDAKIHKQEARAWLNIVSNEIYEDRIKRIKLMNGRTARQAFSNLLSKPDHVKP
jgi:hypothetical protein